MKKRARERAAMTAAEAEVVAAKEKVAETEPETEKVAVTEAAAATVEAEKDGATEAEAAKVDAEKAATDATDATRTGACDEPDHIILLAPFATISYTPVLHLHPIHKTGVHNHPTHPTTAGIPQPVGRPRSGMMWDRVNGEWIQCMPFPPSDIHMCQ